jgi:outer membrane lipoprotein-sorting protein
MSRLLTVALFLLLPLAAQAADDKMLYVEYQLAGKQIAEGSFDAQVKKVWRLGNKFLRFEDAPNPQTKIHGLIIVAEPDIWIMDRKTNQAQHTVDPGPIYKIHFPLFASETSEKLRQLEFGSELDYFRDNDAAALPDQEVDGTKCKLLRLQIDDRDVTLFLRANDTPLQIVVKSPRYEYAMRFLRYEPDRKPDKSLFQLPPGVQLKN